MNYPLAKGNTNKKSIFGFDILTANRIKMGRNNNRSLAGSGIKLELTPNLSRMLENNRKIFSAWSKLFIENIHALNLRPPKWEESGRQPRLDDIVLFVHNDAVHADDATRWKLGKISKVKDRAVEVMFYVQTPSTKKMVPHVVQRNPRDISILFSLDEVYVNSKEYFSKK